MCWSSPRQSCLKCHCQPWGRYLYDFIFAFGNTSYIFIDQVHSKIIFLFFPFLFLKFRIPTIRTLIILFFLPLLSSTLPKSELRAAITTISTSDHSKVAPSKNEEKSPTAALSVAYTSTLKSMANLTQIYGKSTPNVRYYPKIYANPTTHLGGQIPKIFEDRWRWWKLKSIF